MAEWAKKSTTGTALGFGIGGTVLGLLNGGLGMLNNGGVVEHGHPPCSENTPVTRWDIEQAEKLAAEKAKNSELLAEKHTDEKLIEVYSTITQQINGVKDKIEHNAQRVDAELREIAVYQGINTATISCLKGQADSLQGVLASFTETVVPQSRVCNTTPGIIVANTACNPVQAQLVTTTAS